MNLLVTEGPTALTPVRIHRETGVARTTVYRHWPTPGHLVAQLLVPAIARHDIGSYTGELEHDLRVAVDSLVFRFRNRPVRGFYDAARTHCATEEWGDMSRRFVAGLMAPIVDTVDAAIERGDLRAGSARHLADHLAGPLLLRHLLLGEDVTDAEVEELITGFIARYGSASASGS
ncbi:MAG: TetR/AcrR family transcriptional regulator C-terminal ligand-binding domain-containing protein [Actinomycetota bacterium]